MGTKERRERERDAVRVKILDAARELFAVQGYEGVSMRAIAERIEYSPTLIYQHFKDKEALIHALCYEDFGKLAEDLQDAQKIADPIERLLECGRGYARFALDHPNHYRLMFMTPRPAGIEEDKAAMEEVKGKPELDAYAFLSQLVGAAAEAGMLKDPNGDRELTAQTMWAGLHGVIALEIALEGDGWIPWRPLSTRIETMLQTLGTGLFKGER